MEGDYQSAQFILDTLSFLFDRWEFLIGLLIGGGGASYFTYKITIKKKNQAKIKQDGEDSQATEVVDSPNSPPQTAGGDAVRLDGDGGIRAVIHGSPGATINLGSEPRVGSSAEALGPNSVPSTPDVAALDLNQFHILQKVQEILQRLDISSSFAGRYQNAISHLNNNSAQVCASEYHSAFLDVVPVFLSRTTYSTEVPEETNLTALSTSFGQIRTFMSNSSHDSTALRTHVRSFEDSLLILLGYL